MRGGKTRHPIWKPRHAVAQRRDPRASSVEEWIGGDECLGLEKPIPLKQLAERRLGRAALDVSAA